MFAGVQFTMLRSFKFGLLLMASGTASANDLLQYYQSALAHDAVLQSASAQRDATIEAKPQALAQLLPQILATGSAERERVGSETLTTCSQSSDNLPQCYGNAHGYALTLSQTIWSFQSFSLLKQANRQAASAQAMLMSAQQTLLLRVAQAYFGILAATDQLTTATSEREAFQVLLGQAKTRLDTGVGPRSDVEQAQSFYDATEQGVIDARNTLDDADLALAEIVGSSVAGVAPLQNDIPLQPPQPASVDEWVAAARVDNPLLRAAQLNVEAADYAISVQLGKGLPVLSLTGSSSRSWQDQSIGGAQTLDTVGLFVNWPLFQGGAVASGVRQSRATYRQALADYETALREAEKQTRAAYRGVVTGIQRITAAQRAVTSARAAVEASKRNVDFGTGTEFDLLNAQNNYSAALRAYSQTRYDYLTSLLTLKQQSGRLSEKDLAAIDDLLVAGHS